MTEHEPIRESSHDAEPGGPAPQNPAGHSPAGIAAAPASVRIPLLVSAILNCLAALGWAAGCVTVFIGIPLVVLAVFEFITYGKLGEPEWRQYKNRARTIQILEICSILLGSLGSMVCGIVGLVMARQEEEKGLY